MSNGNGVGVALGKVLGGKGDLLRFYDLGSVSRDFVEERLSGHRALRQLGKVATFQMLGHSVVESPESATLEFLMARIAELLNRLVNRASGERSHLRKIHHQIGGAFLAEFGAFVSVDALAHVGPVGNHATNSRRKNRVQVPKDVDRVTASELHIRREAKVFANHHLVADANGSGERFVMRVTQPKNQLAVIAIDALPFQGEAAEVAQASTRKCVFFLRDLKTRTTKSITGAISEEGVRDWSVGVGRLRSRNCFQLLNLYFVLSEN